MFYLFTSFFKMFTREEILKVAEEKVSIAKYLKPEAQAEVQIIEEKIQKKSSKPEDIQKLIDIVTQNIDIINQQLKSKYGPNLKDELVPIVKGIHKMKQLDEIESEFETIYQILDGIHKEDCTEEEWNKKYLLYNLANLYQYIFSQAHLKILAETIKLRFQKE